MLSGRNRESRSREAAGRRNSREAVPNGEGGMEMVRKNRDGRFGTRKSKVQTGRRILIPSCGGLAQSPRWDGIAFWNRRRCDRKERATWMVHATSGGARESTKREEAGLPVVFAVTASDSF